MRRFSWKSVLLFLFVGPLIGHLAVFLTFGVASLIDKPSLIADVGNWLLGLLISVPFAYAFGGVQALLTGIAYGALRDKLAPHGWRKGKWALFGAALGAGVSFVCMLVFGAVFSKDMMGLSGAMLTACGAVASAVVAVMARPRDDEAGNVQWNT